MNLGILTFHSQLNYGGVLQCWALKTALEQMGHEVVVVDKWLSPTNHMLWQSLTDRSPGNLSRQVLHALLGCGHGGRCLRIFRTVRFVRGLCLTPYHFYDWKDAPADLGVDLLVVGSDQVWNPGWVRTRAYLLEPVEGVPHISYAASFGVPALPEDVKGYYQSALKRFSAISCREQEGVEICRGLGLGAAHVVDPTLLLEPEKWGVLLKRGTSGAKRRTLVCYFLSESVDAALPSLEAFARRERCIVEILTNDGHYRRFPKSVKALVGNLLPSRRVRIRNSAGPVEFVRAFASATWTLTDSFHAVMFSTIFNCNARFLRPTIEFRKTMFARIEEFAAKCIKGGFFVDNVDAALSSFGRGEQVAYDSRQIAALRVESMKWLQGELGGCT